MEAYLLKGKNPDDLRGIVIEPIAGMKVFAVPSRALEVLDVTIDGKPVMYRNPIGHLSRFSYDGTGLGPLKSIEAAFTAGPDNVGGFDPALGLSLHGFFSQTSVDDLTLRETETGGVSGIINCERMVTGPSLLVHRNVEPVKDKHAFRIKDILEATRSTHYMWLYHPNFPIENGTVFYSSERIVVPRDKISEIGSINYRHFNEVGGGETVYPPSTDRIELVMKENFEKCYIMHMKPDEDGNVYVMLIAPDGKSASYIKYNVMEFHNNQKAFQLWKNPRDGVCGLEVGSTFKGWAWAKQHNLLSYMPYGGKSEYTLEIGFLLSRKEVNQMKSLIDHARHVTPRHAPSDNSLSDFYHRPAEYKYK